MLPFCSLLAHFGRDAGTGVARTPRSLAAVVCADGCQPSGPARPRSVVGGLSRPAPPLSVLLEEGPHVGPVEPVGLVGPAGLGVRSLNKSKRTCGVVDDGLSDCSVDNVDLAAGQH